VPLDSRSADAPDRNGGTRVTRLPSIADNALTAAPAPTRFAHVIVDVPLPQPLDYRLPEELAQARPGDRCLVPVGRRKLVGIVVALAAASALPAQRIRPVEALLQDLPPLDAHWLALTHFAATYYQHPWGEVALPALPALLRRPPGPRHAQSLARLRAQRPTVVPHAPPAAPLPHALHPEQQAAVAAIAAALAAPAPGFAPFLLFGVTGSGKTDVYLAAIAMALRRSATAQALLLVPEINLTPQLQARLRDHFPGEPIVALHSGMADAERAAAWLAGHEGRARIVLGTRLAVFASLPHLALVAVDEEHDPSYKAGDGVRYSARDLAVKRAQLAGVPVVLGSATPALETWSQAAARRYVRLDLTRRAAPAAVSEAGPPGPAGAALPTVELIDLKRDPLEHGLTAPLRQALAQTLARGEQALVFLNRRGYAPVVACGACGWLSECPHCATFAAFHKVDRVLRCHHCGWQQPVPRACPTCGNQDLDAVGQGTQRIEERLAIELPGARIARIDRDSTRRQGAARDALAAVHAGDTDVLVGTQMIAKGHDFQNVSLVAVLNADAQLVNTDFRAPERLFATLMQVAGRAGRGQSPGRVLIQTRFPGHPLFAALVRHDYPAFAAAQLQDRRDARLPPYVAQALLTAQARAMELAIAWLEAARASGAALAAEAGYAVRLFDAVPMPLPRVAAIDRAQLLVEADQRSVLQAFLAAWLARLREASRTPGGAAESTAARGPPRAAGARWQIDVDPQHI
jgi:primosomal protein N' (replication factor Y)